jgi:hypothetical protein
MSRKLIINIIAAAISTVGMGAVAVAGPLDQQLTAEVASTRDAEVARKSAPDAAQIAAETTIQGVLSRSGASIESATAAITATKTALGCETPGSATCPVWVANALDSVARQIAGVKAPAAIGGGGPTAIPPPPAAGAGGGGGGAGYRTT